LLGARHEVRGERSPLVQEMSSGELGDPRLNERRDRLMAILEQHPDAGFPDACSDDAEVEALYRFLRNRRVSLESVIEPHLVATQQRCAAVGEVLVIHDTTDMVFAGESQRAGLAPLGNARHGFWLHTALAISADGWRVPLGVLSLMPFIRQTRASGGTLTSRDRIVDSDKESRCWTDGVGVARARIGREVAAIHVMDRGADSYALFAALLSEDERFVVRLAQDRLVVTAEGAESLSAAAPQTAMCVRQVTVAPRHAGNRPRRSVRQHPPREGRVATLHVAARAVAVQRPERLPATVPRSLSVNVVYVWEVAPPPGEEPVLWRLITTEPINTAEQVMRIVDWYRTRWVIEEFFKALKTGCAYEKRQLESLNTLLVALALLAPIAWQLLLLRHLARDAPDAAATTVLSARQLHVLRASPGGATLQRNPTVGAALLAVARLGGHLKQNGHPGWLVLGRGMQKLLWMEAGWAAAEHEGRCDQS
jgi:hypothetical protein